MLIISIISYLRFMKEKPKGGQRKGAGRKPSTDPKLPITIFVETSIVELFGGKDGVKFACYGTLYETKARDLVTGRELIGPALPDPAPSFVAPKKPRVPLLKPQERPKTDFEIAAKVAAKDTILRQIAVIKTASIPKDRDTPIGRKAWEMERKKHIEELEKQLTCT